MYVYGMFLEYVHNTKVYILVMLAIICSWYVFSRVVINFDDIAVSMICNELPIRYQFQF